MESLRSRQSHPFRSSARGASSTAKPLPESPTTSGQSSPFSIIINGLWKFLELQKRTLKHGKNARFFHVFPGIWATRWLHFLPAKKTRLHPVWQQDPRKLQARPFTRPLSGNSASGKRHIHNNAGVDGEAFPRRDFPSWPPTHGGYPLCELLVEADTHFRVCRRDSVPAAF